MKRAAFSPAVLSPAAFSPAVLAPIALVVAALASVPFLTASNVVLNFLTVTLLMALVGQGWNVLGGYGGQYSFGHAAFFGTGAYVTAVLQMRSGVNAWAAFALGIGGGALVGAAIGALAFRSGLKGSYFALVTLAFAEVLRILASVAPVTGAGVGVLIALDLRPQAFQFQSRVPFYWIVLALVAASLVLVQAIARSRFGARLVAVGENEDAARALGVDPFRVKLAAMTLSAAITAAAGGFYAQYFLFVDSGIAYGPWISVEALLVAITGGVGTVLGPLLGALAVRILGELTKAFTGDAPGLDLVIYGGALVLIIAFAPRGIAGLFARLRPWTVGCAKAALGRRAHAVPPLGDIRRDTACARMAPAGPSFAHPTRDGEPFLRVERVSRRFGGLLAVDDVSFALEADRVTALIGPNGAGKTTLFAIISGFLAPSEGRIFHRGAEITGMPPHALARRGIARTFQIVQPFPGLTVHENIAVGAHLRHRARADALAVAADIAGVVGLGDQLERPASGLTIAGRKRLELARALATGPQLLLLDEVLASLNPAEVAAMLPVVRALAGRGITILMTEHVMQAVMHLADRVFVLAEGRIIAQGTPREVVGDPRVVEAYLGRGAAARLATAGGAHA